MTLDKVLTWFSNGWIALIVILNVLGIASMVILAPTIWDGISKIQEIYSPFNLWNWAAELIALSPAFAAYAWRERRRKQRPVSN